MALITFLRPLTVGKRRKNMCEQRKIDFYPTPELFQLIRNDTELFEIFKKDKGQNIMVININEFLNRLLHEYFDDYIKELEGYSSHISKILKNSHVDEDIITDVINLLLAEVVFADNTKTKKKGNKSSTEHRYFKTTDKYETLDIIENIESQYLSQYPSLSDYICKMLQSYLNLCIFVNGLYLVVNIILYSTVVKRTV